MNLIEEIKQRTNIIDLAGSFGMKINSSGFINSFYKEDKTASLKIYPESNSFYCFATSQGGDIIKFYQDYKRIDTKEAVKELSEWLNIGTIPYNKNNESERVFKTFQNSELKLLSWEKEFYNEREAILEAETDLEQEQIKLNICDMILQMRKDTQSKIYEALYQFNYSKVMNEDIYNYLTGKERGLTDKTISDFKLFSINSIKENIEFLKDNFEREEIILSGLFKNKYFLFTKHRLIIPYIEAGKITYLRGRYFFEGEFKPENFGKYIGLNNWTNTLSPKRFFNIDILTKIRPFTDLVITEGEFDSMIVNQNNTSALGIAGVSNFPKEQIKLLDKFNIYLAFDNDSAGEKAVQDVSKLFSKPIKQIVLKNHKDFSELFNE